MREVCGKGAPFVWLGSDPWQLPDIYPITLAKVVREKVVLWWGGKAEREGAAVDRVKTTKSTAGLP